MRRTMEKFLENTLLYLAGRNTKGPVTTWEPCDGVPRPLAVASSPLRLSDERTLRHRSAERLDALAGAFGERSSSTSPAGARW